MRAALGGDFWLMEMKIEFFRLSLFLSLRLLPTRIVTSQCEEILDKKHMMGPKNLFKPTEEFNDENRNLIAHPRH